MTTPDDLIQGNRLDYPNTPYTRGVAEVHVIEFAAGEARYNTPFGAPFGGASQLTEHDPAVVNAGRDMTKAAKRAGWNLDSYTPHNGEWPYSGIGVTADAEKGVPERVLVGERKLADGDMMYKYTASGEKVPVARFDETLKGWVRL